MKPKMHRSRIFDGFPQGGGPVAILALLLLALSIAGCVRSGIRVIPVPYQDVLTLSADDIVQIMQRAGFTNDQIREFGPELRDALAMSGEAQITIRGKIEVIFRVSKEDILISSLSRGSFMYNVKTGWVNRQ